MHDARSNPSRWSWRRLALATVLVAGMLATAWIAYYCVDVLLLLFVAILLSTALLFPIDWLERLGASRTLAAVIAHLAAISLLVGSILFVWPLAAQQARSLVDSLPDQYQRLRATIERADHTSSRALAERLPAELDDVVENGEVLPTSAVFRNPWSAFEEVLWAVFLLLATILMSVCWSIERPRILQGVFLLFPIERRDAVKEVFSEMESKLGAFVRGQSLLCLLVGLMAFLAYWLIGLPYAALLAVGAGVLETVPVIGPMVAAIPAAIVGFSVSPVAAFWAVAANIVIAAIESYILVPRVMNRTLGLHPVVTLLTIAVLFALLGPVGGVLAIPSAALVQIAFRRWVFCPDGVRGSPEPPPGVRDRRGLLVYQSECLLHDLHCLMTELQDDSHAELEQAEEGLEGTLQALEAALCLPQSEEASA